jgi:hypothetical protein
VDFPGRSRWRRQRLSLDSGRLSVASHAREDIASVAINKNSSTPLPDAALTTHGSGYQGRASSATRSAGSESNPSAEKRSFRVDRVFGQYACFTSSSIVWRIRRRIAVSRLSGSNS